MATVLCGRFGFSTFISTGLYINHFYFYFASAVYELKALFFIFLNKTLLLGSSCVY